MFGHPYPEESGLQLTSPYVSRKTHAVLVDFTEYWVWTWH